MRVAVVGSRGFKNPERVAEFVWSLPPGTEVVSGGARGVDTVAAEVAAARGLKVTIFPADWDRLGRSAGFHRNQTIVGHADKVVAFWDGKSRGTKHTIDLAQAAGKLRGVTIED